jgi:hypothetical protein
MDKTLDRVTDPEIPSAVPGDGTHVPARHGAYGNEPAILEVCDPAGRGDPNSTVIVLKEGLHFIVWQSAASLVENRNLPVVPFVQSVTSAKPDTAIPGRQHRGDGGIGQTLPDRNRGNSEVAKAVEAVIGGDPNVAFTILKQSADEIA